MQLCADGHEEICHETRKCPLCEEIASRESEIEKLNDKIAELESQIE
jgi:hypothetical protein